MRANGMTIKCKVPQMPFLNPKACFKASLKKTQRWFDDDMPKHSLQHCFCRQRRPSHFSLNLHLVSLLVCPLTFLYIASLLVFYSCLSFSSSPSCFPLSPCARNVQWLVELVVGCCITSLLVPLRQHFFHSL